MNKYEKLIYLLDKYIWVFHVVAFGTLLYLGIKEFIFN